MVEKKSKRERMRWGVEKRLEFIEFRLFWEGGINRADIMERFGVSVPQASKDLSLYEQQAPRNLVYDKRRKRYLASPNFRPVFLRSGADRYLAQLRSLSDDVVPLEETWLSSVPDTDAMPVPRRRVDVKVLRAIIGAIRQRRGIQILYQSMNPQRPEPVWRWITPHALSTDGLRWHVRAYCHIDSRFKDFLLSRCTDARGDSDGGATPEDDVAWNEKFLVVLSPNHNLTKEQQAIIQQDYGMTEGRVIVPVRKALLYYFQKRLRLDAAGSVDGPNEAPVVISNAAEFAQALAEASA